MESFRTSKVYKLWSSDASNITVGNVGDQESALLRICMITLLSAFPVRMSYRVKLRSEPILPNTEVSLRLKRIDVTVSVAEGNVRFMMAVVL